MGISGSTYLDLLSKTLTDISIKIIEENINNEKIVKKNNNNSLTVITSELFKKINNSDLLKALEDNTKLLISNLNIKQTRENIEIADNIYENSVDLIKVVKFCNVNNETFTVKTVNNKITEFNRDYINSVINNCLKNENFNHIKQDINSKLNKLSNLDNNDKLDLRLINVIFSGFIIGSITIGRKNLNILLILGGVFLFGYLIKKTNEHLDKKSNLKSNYFYLTNTLDKYLDLTKIKEEKILDENLRIELYGDADFYEVYNDKIILYKNNNQNNSLDSLKSDYKDNSRISEFKKYEPRSAYVKILNIDQFKDEKIYLGFQHDILDSFTIDKEGILSQVAFYTYDFNSGKLHIKLKYSDTEYETKRLFLKETIVYETMKKVVISQDKNLNFLVYSALGSIVIGIILSLISFFKK